MIWLRSETLLLTIKWMLKSNRLRPVSILWGNSQSCVWSRVTGASPSCTASVMCSFMSRQNEMLERGTGSIREDVIESFTVTRGWVRDAQRKTQKGKKEFVHNDAVLSTRSRNKCSFWLFILTICLPCQPQHDLLVYSIRFFLFIFFFTRLHNSWCVFAFSFNLNNRQTTKRRPLWEMNSCVLNRQRWRDIQGREERRDETKDV